MPLSKKFYSDFFIKELFDNGFEVQYWDLTKIFWSNLFYPNEIHHKIIKKYNSFNELKNDLSGNKNKLVLYIPYFPYCFETIKLFRILTKVNAIQSFFRIGLYPSPTPGIRNVLKNEYFKLIDPLRIIRFFKNKIKNHLPTFLKKIKFIKEFDFVFAAGEKAIEIFLNKTKVIQINLSDYDKYRNIKKININLVNHKYAVFHDEDLISHPDLKMSGYEPIEEEKYFDLLNNFFIKVEKEFGLEVIIAASPKANYIENPFQNRKIVFEKTAELVKNAEFSIVFASTSVSFPILFYKPIVFINTTEIGEKITEYKYLPKYWSEYLNCQFYLLDELTKINKIIIKDVSKEDYDKYKYNYLTTKETENKFSVDIVVKSLHNYFDQII